MIDLMKENDAPSTQFERVGFSLDGMSKEQLITLNQQCKINENINDFDDYNYIDQAKMQLKMFLRFIPEESLDVIKHGLKQYLAAINTTTIDAKTINSYIGMAIPKEKRAIMSYFISIAGRKY